MSAYPSMASAGWNTTSITRLVSGNDGVSGQTYWNAPNGNSDSSIDQADVLSGPDSQTDSQSIASNYLSSTTSTSLATGKPAQVTSVRGATGACQPVRPMTSLQYLLVLVVLTSIVGVLG
jgi:hypothetical protein